VVIVRDEEWLVTKVEPAVNGRLLRCQGLSELVRDTTATFYEGIEDIIGLEGVKALDPADAAVLADDSPRYRKSRLWLESTLRKTSVPIDGAALTVSTSMLANSLGYQETAVKRALDPENLRPRILLADAVGLGKTLEIGMILAELIRRGRGERILIVTPRHVLEQMQNEMWSRFAIPFVRLDSKGIQRVRQKLPATRNPFSYYKRVIISIDTLKSDQYLAHLQHQNWDAVVIDESHNVTNVNALNNRLARTLSPKTDALILASATPHNGKAESFAELIRLLEPTAVRPDGTLIEDEVRRLVIRRHRNSPEVAQIVGADWAERKEPQNWLVPASPSENAVADELDAVWLHPESGKSPYSGKASDLFPWTLAKAFLSSPAALLKTIDDRINRIKKSPSETQSGEIVALERLRDLTKTSDKPASKDSGKTGSADPVPMDPNEVAPAKYTRLLSYLKKIGIRPDGSKRAVIFAERVPTLEWLQERLIRDLKLKNEQTAILNGDQSDDIQQGIVGSFKQTSSPIRVLITSDVASEGVNLHAQCHELIHFDIPWSLIRIEQRNGRIDRYGQRERPQITTLLLSPSAEGFSGDLHVLTRVIEREKEAHAALGDAASLMGMYDGDAEEAAIKKVLAGKADFDDVVKDVATVKSSITPMGMFARVFAGETPPPPPPPVETPEHLAGSLYPTQVAFLEDAFYEAYPDPGAPPGGKPGEGGVGWRNHGTDHIVELVPPSDLRQRLEVLPQSYLADRKVTKSFKLVTAKDRGKKLLDDALKDETNSSWPEAHYLGPLHPVIDWAADRAMASLGRNQVFAVRGDVEHPTVLMLGTLTNRRGQVVASCYMSAVFTNPDNPESCFVHPHDTAAEMVAPVGYGAARNPGPVAGAGKLQPLIATAAREGTNVMNHVFSEAEAVITARVSAWSHRAVDWENDASALIQRREVVDRRNTVQEEQKIAAAMVPERQLVRPLLVVVPADHPVAEAGEE
jgi:superfamily II DNA or RNA helicase